MLRLQGVTLARGVRVLYRGVSLLAPDGERIGLVGANGSGKSTLFSAILGQLGTEAGSIEAPPPERIAHVAQDIETTHDSALDYVVGGHAPLAAARAAVRQAEDALHDPGKPKERHDALEMALAEAIAHLAELNEGAIVAQAAAVMHGLGFASSDGMRQVREFSGGWRNRLALGRALLRPAQLLLLDEPTNHLDIDSVVWLEAWLRRQPATVVLISHDREFLDHCTTVTWNVADDTIRRYAGNYSAFEQAWLEQQKQQEAAARQYERTAAHLTRFVERFRAQASKARQAQSRLKMLERLESIEPARARREWRFEFLTPQRLPEHMVDAEELALGYGDRTILADLRFSLRAGDRIGILGVNGAGKSTLVKAIAGELAPHRGSLRRGAGLMVGYFAQHQLDQLRADESPLQHLRRLAPDRREQELREFLGTYRFSGEMATAPLGPRSGGEKARCALALLAWQRPNLLVLDEPTNHLDMETREALTMALSSFEGALLLVSHDRHLLRATTDQLWLVHDGRLAPFEGDLDDYAALVLASRRVRNDDRPADDAAPRGAKGASGVPNASRGSGRRDQRRGAADRQRPAAGRKPLERQVEVLERELTQVGDELRLLDARLAVPDYFHTGDPAEVAATLERRAGLALRIETLESAWLGLHTQLEALG